MTTNTDHTFGLLIELARRMHKTLTRINRVIDKRKAYEAGDKLMAIAEAMKLTFVVEHKETSRTGSFYADSDWRFMTVEEGRNRYRQLIQEQINLSMGKAA